MTDTIQDGQTRRVPIIFMGGPIKYWWTCWDSFTHRQYLRHRQTIREWLTEFGYLTYAPWEALKGTWDNRAQDINLWAIGYSDLFVNLTPRGIPAEETEREQRFAEMHSIPTTHVIPGLRRDDLWEYLAEVIGPGLPYEN